MTERSAGVRAPSGPAIGPAVGLLAAAAVAPPTLLSVAFGPRLTDASGAPLPLAGAMTCLGATVLFTHYPLALASRAIPAALGITTVGAVAPVGSAARATASA